MNVFLLAMNSVNKEQSDHIYSGLQVAFEPENTIEVSTGTFLIAVEQPCLPSYLAEKLGDPVYKGVLGSYLVVPVSSYWGFQDKSVWNWLLSKGV